MTFALKDRSLLPSEIRVMLKQLEHVATLPTAMVPWPTTTARTSFDHERLKAAPFFIAHQTTDQGRLPKTTLNQILPLLGIPFVNTP